MVNLRTIPNFDKWWHADKDKFLKLFGTSARLFDYTQVNFAFGNATETRFMIETPLTTTLTCGKSIDSLYGKLIIELVTECKSEA